MERSQGSYNVDPNLFDPSSILINPSLPKGVPPHLWKKEDGHISVMEEASSANLPILLAPAKPKLGLKHYLYMGLTSLALAILLKLLLP